MKIVMMIDSPTIHVSIGARCALVANARKIAFCGANGRARRLEAE
jgi:hypothetical protein